MKCLRSVPGYSLLHRKRNKDFRRQLNIQSLQEKIKENKAHWYENLYSLTSDRLPVATLNLKENMIWKTEKEMGTGTGQLRTNP